jgi:muconate cycloisomerase
MKIVSLEILHVQLPTRRVHRWTGLTEPIGGYLLIRLLTDAGIVGLGEAPVLKDWAGDAMRYFGESPAIAATVIRSYLEPAVRGQDPTNIAALHRRMDAAIPGYPYSKAAVEIAAYDAMGKALGLPVSSLLGGAVRDRVPVTHSIGLLPIEEAVVECAAVAREGIRTIKLKVGVEPARDIELVRRVREAVGPAVGLCVDANRGYASPREAIRILRAMEPYGLLYAEQPVEGIEALAEVARALGTPLMADESAWTPQDVLAIAERRAAEIISLYTTKPGGLCKAKKVAAVAEAAGLRCNVNGSVEMGIGNAANLHLAAAAEPATLSCVIPVSAPQGRAPGLAGNYYADDIIREPFVFLDGCLVVPTGPGLGVELDEAKVARYQVGSAVRTG